MLQLNNTCTINSFISIGIFILFFIQVWVTVFLHVFQLLKEEKTLLISLKEITAGYKH